MIRRYLLSQFRQSQLQGQPVTPWVFCPPPRDEDDGIDRVVISLWDFRPFLPPLQFIFYLRLSQVYLNEPGRNKLAPLRFWVEPQTWEGEGVVASHCQAED